MASNDDAEVKELRFVDLVPDRLRAGPDLWVRAYRMLGVPLDALRPRLTIDLGNSVVVLFWGSLPRLSLTYDFEPTVDGHVQINVSTDSGMHQHAPTALVMVPIVGDWNDETIQGLRGSCEETAGLLSLHSLSLIAFMIEEYVVRLPDGRIEPTAVKVADGSALSSQPIVSPALAEGFEDIAAVLSAHPDRRRLGLALRWLDQARRSEGVDGFLKAWFAIETLAMPNTTNIRPLNELLAVAYSSTVDDVRIQFRTGRLFGLRGTIVHDGDTEPVPPLMLTLMHALFSDLFFVQLGWRTRGLAQIAINEHPEVISMIDARSARRR